MRPIDVLAQRIIEALKNGTVPWQKPWAGGGVPGRNLITNRPYRGFNWLATFLAGFDSEYWLTRNQLRQLGGWFRNGERGTPIFFFRMVEKRAGDEDSAYPLYRYYKVWNIRQCDIPAGNIPTHAIPPTAGPFKPLSEDERIMAADHILLDWTDAPRVHHDRQHASYAPATDTITMPAFASFVSPEEYYSTLYHEMIHATGHPTRLDRKSLSTTAGYNSRSYGIEELVAEIGSARLCWEAGIHERTIDNSAAYIAGWLASIGENPTMIVRAANQADRAAAHILKEDTSDDW